MATAAAPGLVQDQLEAGRAVELLNQEARTPLASARAQRLKDMVYLKDLRAAITSGEFALQLRGAEQPGLIDFQGLYSRFETFATKLKVQPLDHRVLPVAEAGVMLRKLESMCKSFEDRALELARSSHHAEASGVGERVEAATAAAKAAAAKVASTVDMADPRKLLYWREDQTVDFDGALTEANKAAKFSADLWERLNGGEEVEGEFSLTEQTHIPDTETVAEKRQQCWKADSLLMQAEQDLEEIKKRVADPAMLGWRPSELRQEFRDAEQFVRECRSRTLLTSIDLLLEQAAAQLEAELEKTTAGEWDASGSQLKLSVVEFSLLDKQATYYWQFLPEDPEVCRLAECIDVSGAVDAEELRVLKGDVVKFAGELGLEVEEVEDPTPFTGAFRLFAQLERNVEKARAGFAFYTFGGQLLWQDIQYAASLFSKAAFSQYTLKPREVRAVQRTAKDLVTLVPFLIILIIPLTPIGHVLVFSFIQKFFPDFFPSTFTERRQNVVKIYQDIVPAGAQS